MAKTKDFWPLFQAEGWLIQFLQFEGLKSVLLCHILPQISDAGEDLNTSYLESEIFFAAAELKDEIVNHNNLLQTSRLQLNYDLFNAEAITRKSQLQKGFYYSIIHYQQSILIRISQYA